MRGRSQRRLLRAVAAGLLALLSWAPPSRAIEQVEIEIPLLESRFRLNLRDLQTSGTLQGGDDALAELDRATNGALGRNLLAVLRQPVPLSLRQVADGSVGSPLLEQALLLLSSFGTVEGAPPDLTGRSLQLALQQASTQGPPSLLSLMQAIPGSRATLDLGRIRLQAQRMLRQRRQAEALLAAAPAAAAATVGVRPSAVRSRRLLLSVRHRDQPLDVTVVEPLAAANGRLVLISHGLWDAPSGFEGWGSLLASHGYTVLLPRHPGSDSSQQRAVLAGTSPPPGPEELALRPADLRALLDALADGTLVLSQPVDAGRVVVLGHSWGATTALQLAGLQTSDSALRQRCRALDDPDRNLSWTLQCSWLSAAAAPAVADARVLAVGAVSPPVSLLFPPGSAAGLSGRVLLVSGSRDWVVPPDPEAVEPMRRGARQGHQLVLVRDGDHFNLRPGQDPAGGPIGPLLLRWTEAAFAAGAASRPGPNARPLLPLGAWGSAAWPMAEVSNRLGGS